MRRCELLALGLGAVDEGGPLFGVGIAKFPTAFTGRSRCDFVAQAAAGVDHKDVQEEGACGGGGAGDDRSKLRFKLGTIDLSSDLYTHHYIRVQGAHPA